MNAGGISEKGRELAAKNREEFRRKKFGSFKGNRIKTDSEKYMSYPMARGPNDETGDTLLIKCVKYQPPSPETEMGLEDFTINGTDLMDQVVQKFLMIRQEKRV